MSTTILPDHAARPITGTAEETLALVAEGLRSAYGDYDVCTDPEGSAYYAGLIDAYADVLRTLTGRGVFDE